MPLFEDDIFISYAHNDNASGWVDKFHERLRERLQEFTGRKPKIWRDIKNLDGGDYFSDEIKDRLAQTKTLIVVMGPGYVASKWCKIELQEFCSLAQLNGGTRVGNKSRVIKVVKLPIPRESYPQELQGPLDYMFYEEDPDNDKPRTFSQEPDGHQYQNYLDKVDDLVWSIKRLLEDLDNHEQPIPPPAIEKTIYLAETSTDRVGDRDKIKRELEDRGYLVLPDKELPLETSQYQERVRANLMMSCLSIHLLGEKYGLIPDGEEVKSIVVLQNELAAERSGDPNFSRLIWIPEGLEPKGERQTNFIRDLETSCAAQKGAEFLRRSFEGLKTRIIEKITTPEPPKLKQRSPFPNQTKSIYVIYDRRDFSTVMAVEDYLFKKGYEVILSAKEGDAAQISEYHRENLLECDATLIYYGLASELWLRSKLWDLKKTPVWGRTRPMLCKAIYITDPETEQKQRLKTWEAILLPAYFKPLPPEPLELVSNENGNGAQADSVCHAQMKSALNKFIAEIESAQIELAPTGSGGSR